MAVSLNDVKLYLRIDVDAEDALLQACMAAASAYLTSAVSDFTANYRASADFAAKADLVSLALISEMYRNRDPSNDNRGDYPFYLRSQITQLQYWVAPDEEDTPSGDDPTAGDDTPSGDDPPAPPEEDPGDEGGGDDAQP